MINKSKTTPWITACGIKNLLLTTLMFISLERSAIADSGTGDIWRGWQIGAGASYLDLEGEISLSDGYYESNEEAVLGGFSLGYTFGAFGADGGSTGIRIGTTLEVGFGDFSSSDTNDVLGDLEIDGSFYAAAFLRVGYSTDRFWIYGMLGLSGSDYFIHSSGSDDTTVLLTGAIGVGAEVKLSESWGLNAEAIFSAEGSSDQTFGSKSRSVSVRHNAFRLGLVKRF